MSMHGGSVVIAIGSQQEGFFRSFFLLVEKNGCLMLPVPRQSCKRHSKCQEFHFLRPVNNPLLITGCLGKMCILQPVGKWLQEVACCQLVKLVAKKNAALKTSSQIVAAAPPPVALTNYSER